MKKRRGYYHQSINKSNFILTISNTTYMFVSTKVIWTKKFDTRTPIYFIYSLDVTDIGYKTVVQYISWTLETSSLWMII